MHIKLLGESNIKNEAYPNGISIKLQIAQIFICLGIIISARQRMKPWFPTPNFREHSYTRLGVQQSDFIC